MFVFGPIDKKNADRIEAIISELYKMKFHSVYELVELLGGQVEVDYSKEWSLDEDVIKLEDYIDDSLETPAFKIVVSDKVSPERKLFIVCRGVGHLLLHMGYPLNKGEWVLEGENKAFKSNSHLMDKEAEYFAQCFIMPKDQYIAACKEFSSSETVFCTADKVAKVFEVAPSLVISRGLSLGIVKRN